MDVFDVMFACDYKVCKGICCVEGDSGAPLSKGEREMLEKHLPAIRHLLAPRALEIIEEQGVTTKKATACALTRKPTTRAR